MTRAIVFQRGGRMIIAQIYSRYMEPLGNRQGYQEVLFCEDSQGMRYRVLKQEVLLTGRLKKQKRNKKKAKVS